MNELEFLFQELKIMHEYEPDKPLLAKDIMKAIRRAQGSKAEYDAKNDIDPADYMSDLP